MYINPGIAQISTDLIQISTHWPYLSSNIYSFNYKWDSEVTWIGVMAQELLDTGYSDAVGMDSEGFYNVNYSKLGFPMIGFK